MSLVVLDPGLFTLVVDQGRPHSRSFGVPVGGAADRTALAIGNALVGNPLDAAALEITLAGPTLRATCEIGCVVYGAPFELFSERQPVRVGTTFTLAAGEEIRIGRTPHQMRAYLCVCGGLQSPMILDSRTALNPMTNGDVLPCIASSIRRRYLKSDCFGLLKTRLDNCLRVIPGPQADWFETHHFLHDECPPVPFVVTSASNRMGLRLQGPPFLLPPREMVSEPVCPGAVQVTRDGQCIILGVDGQTIGGYPKIAQIASVDLDKLGQLRPGDEVCFSGVTLQEAEHAYRAERGLLNKRLLRIRATLW